MGWSMCGADTGEARAIHLHGTVATLLRHGGVGPKEAGRQAGRGRGGSSYLATVHYLLMVSGKAGLSRAREEGVCPRLNWQTVLLLLAMTMALASGVGCMGRQAKPLQGTLSSSSSSPLSNRLLVAGPGFIQVPLGHGL